MIRKISKFWVMALLLFLGSCKEFIEPSLDTGVVQLHAPADSVQTNIYQQTFWWERLENALQYRLQVASPNFAKTTQLVLDTTVRGDKFVLNLDPGSYEWRVRAENGSSHSAFTKRQLTVFPSSLTNQLVLVALPANAYHTATPEIKYQWGALYGAQQYRLQLDRNQFVDEQKLILDLVVDQPAFVGNLPQEGTYQFRVRAENQTELSKWSTTRTVVFDQTPPERVSLISPTNQRLVSKPVTLTWQAIADADRYELVLLKSDKTTIYNGSFPLSVSATSAAVNLGELGETLAWKVRAVDRAGNKGEYSEINTFTLQ